MTTDLQRAIERFARGEEVNGSLSLDDSFAVIYAAYSDKVYGYFLRKGVGNEDGHDLTATTFVRLWKAASRIDDPSRFNGYLWAIVRNVFKRWLEDRERRLSAVGVDLDVLGAVRADDPLLPASPLFSSQVKDVLRREAHRAVLGAIADLPRKMGQCAHLRFLHGLRNLEVAEALQISASAVGFNLSEARKRIIADLARRGFDGASLELDGGRG